MLDGNGNRTMVASNAGSESYTLDALNRITDASYPGGLTEASAETLDINRAKIAAVAATAAVEYIEADIFQLELGRAFDAIFFSYWLTHVPDDRFEEFWSMVARHLAPGGRVCLFDSAHPESVHRAQGGALNDVHVVSTGTSANDLMSGTVTRSLSDGREFEIVKRTGTRRTSTTGSTTLVGRSRSPRRVATFCTPSQSGVDHEYDPSLRG